MIEAIGKWIVGLAAAAMLCAFAREVTPEGRVRRAEGLVLSLVMLTALISPLTGLRLDEYSFGMAKYRDRAQEIAGAAEEISNSLSRTYIEDSCRAYILDKAEAIGCTVSDARVSLRWSSEGFWYPESAAIYGQYDARLARELEAGLGLAQGEQKWSEK